MSNSPLFTRLRRSSSYKEPQGVSRPLDLKYFAMASPSANASCALGLAVTTGRFGMNDSGIGGNYTFTWPMYNDARVPLRKALITHIAEPAALAARGLLMRSIDLAFDIIFTHIRQQFDQRSL